MRIAFVLPEIGGGGIATCYRNLGAALVGLGHELIVILADLNARVTDASFPGTVLQARRGDYEAGLARVGSFDLFPDLRHKLALSYACKARLDAAGGADVIETTDYNMNFYAFLLHKDSPVVVRLAGSSGQLELHEHRTSGQAESLVLFCLEPSVLNHADYLVSLTRSNKAYWSELLARDIHVHDPYFQVADKQDVPVRSDGRGVVVGRLQLWKGAQFLCEYYAAHPDAPGVDWIGRDNFYLDHARPMSSHLSESYPGVWGRQLNFMGGRPYADTQRAIGEAAFVLVPSSWDTFNFTVVEAMWHGKIVIASSGAGASEHIEDGVTGFVFRANDAASLHDAMTRCAGMSADARAQMQQRARDSVRRRLFDIELVEERARIYAELATRGPRPPTGVQAFLVEKLEAEHASGERVVLRRQPVAALIEALKEKGLSRLGRLR